MTIVSVVITTYNHARFLGDAIQSVLDQTRPPDEIIVVDDGSTDDPASVVGHHAGIRLIRQSNQGLAAARNTGMAAASGEYIAFLDADDRVSPVMVATTLVALEANPDCAFVYGAYAIVDEWGATQQIVPLRQAGEDAYATFLKGNIIGMHGTVLYRRRIAVGAGGFDRTLRACEDYDLYLRLTRRHPIMGLDVVLADYRHHTSNMSRVSPLMLTWVLAVLNKQKATAATRPDWAKAYSKGIAGWKTWYADCQTRNLAQAIRSGRGVIREIDSALAIFRLAPRQSVTGVVAKATRVAGVGRVARVLARKGRFAFGGERPIVLMYHRVGVASVDPWQLTVRPERFAEQIATLAAARHIVPMRWLAARMREGKIPRHTAAVTFDDGYADFLHNALPILRSQSCPATIFLTTGSVDRPDGFWWDHLARLALETSTLPPRLNLKIGGAEIEAFVEDGPEGRRNLLDHLSAIFRRTPAPACWAALDALHDWAGCTLETPARDRALTSVDVGQLARDALVEIGAHTVTHPSMPSLDAKTAAWEAAESRRRCEEWIGRPVEGFSYPFGDYLPASVAAVRSAGLSYACTTVPAPLKLSSEPFQVPRIAVHDLDEGRFRAEVLRYG